MKNIASHSSIKNNDNPGSFQRMIQYISTSVLVLLFISLNAVSQGFDWVNSPGGTSYDEGSFIDCSDNEIFTIGIFEGSATIGSSSFTSYGKEDLFFAKHKKDGTFQWAVQIGSEWKEKAAGLAVDADGNSYLSILWGNSVNTSLTVGPVILSPERESLGACCMLLKFDQDGNLLWNINADDNSYVNEGALAINGAGTQIYWCVGAPYGLDITGPGGSFSDPFNEPNCSDLPLTCWTGFALFQITPEGNFNWSRYNYTGSHVGYIITTLTVDNSDNCYLTGSAHVDIVLVDGSGAAEESIEYSDATFGFIQKFSSTTGDLVYMLKLGDANLVEVAGAATDNSGNLFLLGDFEGTMNLGPYSLSVITGSQDLFVAKIAPDGTTVSWLNQISEGPIGAAVPGRIVSDGTNIYCTVKNTTNPAIIQDAKKPMEIKSINGKLFIVKYSSAGSLSWAAQFGKGSSNNSFNDATYLSGSIYVTGAFDQTAEFGSIDKTSAGNRDAFIARIKSCNSFSPVDPIAATIICGDAYELTTTNNSDYAYQWYGSSTLIEDANDYNFQILAASEADEQKYYCTVDNGNACIAITKKGETNGKWFLLVR